MTALSGLASTLRHTYGSAPRGSTLGGPGPARWRWGGAACVQRLRSRSATLRLTCTTPARRTPPNPTTTPESPADKEPLKHHQSSSEFISLSPHAGPLGFVVLGPNPPAKAASLRSHRTTRPMIPCDRCYCQPGSPASPSGERPGVGGRGLAD